MASLGHFSDAESDAAVIVSVVLSDQQQEDRNMDWLERRECRAIVKAVGQH